MQIYAEMDTGMVRSTNQDAYFAEMLCDNTAFAVVCDGMGGANAGNIASEKAVTVISEYVKKSFRPDMSPGDIAKMLQRAVSSANIEIYDLAVKNAELAGMGTTVVTAVTNGEFAVIVHVGDSRAYLMGENFEQLTRDHSVVQSLLESGKLTPEEAKVHPRKNVITRALGVEETVISDCSERTLKKGEYLLLCTDGLTNFVESREILEIFKNTKIADVAGRLISLANQNGGGDNITAVIIG